MSERPTLDDPKLHEELGVYVGTATVAVADVLPNGISKSCSTHMSLSKPECSRIVTKWSAVVGFGDRTLTFTGR